MAIVLTGFKYTCDFFLWGTLKIVVMPKIQKTVPDLAAAIKKKLSSSRRNFCFFNNCIKKWQLIGFNNFPWDTL